MKVTQAQIERIIMDYDNVDVTVISSPSHEYAEHANVYIGSGDEKLCRFTVIPMESCAAKIMEWLPDKTTKTFVDKEGNPLYAEVNGICTKVTENYGWLIDLTMEYGLRFPAIETC